MLNLTKRVDYGLVALTHLAVTGLPSVTPADALARDEGDVAADAPARLSVRGMAETYNMSQPLLANVMKDLARFGFVRSARGTKGGYELSIAPEALTVGRVVESLEGPLRLTECMTGHPVSPEQPPVGPNDGEREPSLLLESSCSLFESCLIKRSVSIIHQKIREALYSITVADLARQAGPVPTARSASTGHRSGRRAGERALALLSESGGQVALAACKTAQESCAPGAGSCSDESLESRTGAGTAPETLSS